MTAEKTNIQKLEALLNSATNERQRKMYLALLNKAKAELASEPAPPRQKVTKTSTKNKARGKTAKKKAESSPPVGKKTSSKKKATSKKEKQSNNDSVVVTEEISATNQSTSVLETKEDKQSAKDKTKTKQSKSNKKKTPSANNQPYFSGVGIIRGTPYLEGEKVFVTIDEQQYELKQAVGTGRKGINSLKEELAHNGSREMLLRVYPNIIHRLDGTPPRHLFQLVHFYLNEERGVKADGDTPEDRPSQYSELPEEFVFRGIWRFVSYCPNPVITINRNISRLGYYKTLSSDAQKYFAKSQDFPVIWDAPVAPFKYDSERKKSEQMPRYFVQVKAIFKNGQYIVTEMLSEPTLKIPRFIGSPKKNRNSQNKSKQSDQPNQLDKESESNNEVI